MAAVKDMGGLVTDGLERDPVSGNEVPPGSSSEDVRDDIDAKLSPNEYVVPADVLRFYGVSFFEKLRKKAKDGLAEMDSDGRIGGGSAPEKEEEEDDFPFSMEELESEDEMKMAEGGLTENKTPASFNPNDWAFGGTTFGSGSSSAGANQMKQYLDKQGNIVNVLFINGKPIVDVEALGYTEYTGDNTPKATGEAVQSTDVSADNRDRLSDREGSKWGLDSGEESQSQSGPPSWTKDVDWAKMSPEEAIKLGGSRMTNSFLEKGLMGVASMANPMLGLGAAGIVNASNIKDVKNSIATLTAAGNTAAAEALQKSFDASLADKGPAWGWLSGVIEGKPFGSTTTTTAPTTVAPTVPGSIPKVTSPVATPTSTTTSNKSSVTPSGSISASSYNREGSGSGSDWGSTSAAKDSKETVSQAQERAGSIARGETQAAGATSPSQRIESEAYSGMGYTGGRAKGGLVQKPKPKKSTPKRKTKI